MDPKGAFQQGKTKTGYKKSDLLNFQLSQIFSYRDVVDCGKRKTVTTPRREDAEGKDERVSHAETVFDLLSVFCEKGKGKQLSFKEQQEEFQC